MRELTERIISLDNLLYPETLAARIENEAEKMQKDGWFFVNSVTDELMENIVLLFERDM